MNVELLNRVKAAILEEPKRISMGQWLLKANPNRYAQGFAVPACGTVACIAGWMCELSKVKIALRPENTLGIQFPVSEATIEAEAGNLLGEHDVHASKLFFVAYWPQDFRRRLTGVPSQTIEYAQVVSDRIDHFIATGE